IGLSCGILGAAFNIGGPPALIWVFSRPWRREQAVATLQMMFLCNSGLRLILTSSIGMTTERAVLVCVLTLVPFVLAVIGGVRLAQRIPANRFKQVVLGALIAMGFFYLLRG